MAFFVAGLMLTVAFPAVNQTQALALSTDNCPHSSLIGRQIGTKEGAPNRYTDARRDASTRCPDANTNAPNNRHDTNVNATHRYTDRTFGAHPST